MERAWYELVIVILSMWCGVALAGGHNEGSFAKESFTEDDFAQFFSLIENGVIPADKISERCRQQGIGFTFLGENIVHERERQRIFYNVSREDSSVDGRTLRAKHFNASFGEWTGSVFKPLCPGMYLISLDFIGPKNTTVALFLRQAGEQRPGRRVLGSSTGHFTLALPLHSMDEISTWTESNGKATLDQVTFTAVKTQHLEDWVADVDMDLFTEETTLLKKSAQD